MMGIFAAWGTFSVRTLGILSILLLLSLPAFAQDYEWTVKTNGGEEFSRFALDRLSKDSLFIVKQTGLSELVLLDSIATLQHERRSAILPAMIVGAVGGGGIGFALKPVAKDQEQADAYSAVFGAVIGGFAGFVVGSSLQSDEVFEFRQLNRESKAQVLQGLISKR